MGEFNKDFYQLQNNYEQYNHVSSKLLYGTRMTSPFFTVFIPTYKRSATLLDTVRSAVGQIGFDDYEILVINNEVAQSDQIIEQIRELDIRGNIAYYVNESNIGMCGNWNRAIELSRGKYVVMIHDDDILSPWNLYIQNKVIQENNLTGLISCQQILFSDLTSLYFEEYSEGKPICIRQLSPMDYYFGYSTCVAGFTGDRQTLMQLGGYAEDYYPIEDTVLSLQGSIHKKVYMLDIGLAGYRISQNNTSMQPGVNETICLDVHKMRTVLASHISFAHWHMRLFGKENLWLYLQSAENLWNMQMDKQAVLQKAGFDNTKISIPKVFAVKVIQKGYNLYRHIQWKLERRSS